MGFTIEKEAFLLDYFRNGVQQGNGDWSYVNFIPPCIEEFQARYSNLMGIDLLIIKKFINVLKL
jgi:hypothetical protein